MCRHLWPFQDYIFVAIPRYPKIIFLRQRRRERPSYEDGKQSFYSILSSHHWEMGWHQLSITTHFCRISLITYLKCTYFSDDVKCISHLYCAHFCRIFKISTQQLINCALSGLSISGRNSTSPNICSLPPLQIILILLSCSSLYQELGESGVSSSRVGLEPMFIFARHSYIRRTSQCTYITHPCCNRGCCEATQRCRNGTHTISDNMRE